MNSNIGGALISAGSSLVGGIVGAGAQSSANSTNLKIARENNAFNQQLQKEQNQWNLDQWNRENTYNSASAQKQRLIDAGYNPFLATGQVATGSATSSQLTSAPYSPAQQVSVNPVNYGQGISNAGNDFVTSYLNMRMNAAQVKLAEADAQKAQADAAATSGYRADLAKSEQNRNDILNKLTSLQSEMQSIQNQIQTRWGDQVAKSTLEQIESQRNLNMSQRNLNEDMLDKVASEVKLNVARANNLDKETHKLSELTPYIKQQLLLTNSAEEYKNKILKVDSDWEFNNGKAKRDFGIQGLMHDSNIKKKDDQYYWPSKGLNALGTANSLGKMLKFSK